jgi:molecular chaperone GrpE
MSNDKRTEHDDQGNLADAAIESLMGNDGGGESPEEVERLRRQLDEAEKKALMYQADLDNFRRRKNRETAEQLRYANLPVIQDLLGIIDNFERALQTAKAGGAAGDSLQKGVEMVFLQLRSLLDGAGCKRIEAVGCPFDPNIHESLGKRPSDYPANIIIEESQPGYQLHERVIRPAKVIISGGPGESGN